MATIGMEETLGVTQEGAVDETTEATPQVAEQTDDLQSGASEKTEITQDEVEAIEGEGEARTVPYDRFKEVNDQYRAIREEMAALRAKADLADKLQEAFSPKPVEQEMPPQVKAALETLKQYGVTTKDEILAEVDQRLNETFEQREFRQRLLTDADALEKKYDGSDGRPRFVRSDVAKWLDDNRFTQQQLMAGGITLEKAYKLMHEEAIADAAAKQKKSTAFSEKPGQPMASNNDTRGAELEEARKTGDFTNYLKKYVPMPGR